MQPHNVLLRPKTGGDNIARQSAEDAEEEGPEDVLLERGLDFSFVFKMYGKRSLGESG